MTVRPELSGLLLCSPLSSVSISGPAKPPLSLWPASLLISSLQAGAPLSSPWMLLPTVFFWEYCASGPFHPCSVAPGILSYHRMCSDGGDVCLRSMPGPQRALSRCSGNARTPFPASSPAFSAVTFNTFCSFNRLKQMLAVQS